MAMGEEPDAMEPRCLPGTYQTDDGEPHWQAYIDHALGAIAAVRGTVIDAALQAEGGPTP